MLCDLNATTFFERKRKQTPSSMPPANRYVAQLGSIVTAARLENVCAGILVRSVLAPKAAEAFNIAQRLR
jgi:hypothetical protein